MKPRVHESTDQQPLAPEYDELYRQPLRATRGVVVAFRLTLLVWIVLFGAWWTIAHHRPAAKAPVSPQSRQ